MISPIINVNDSENGFTQDHGFLLKKLFSTDFRAQFETYMYKTYPWRYANIFIDKDGAKKKVNAIISFLGVLILIFGFTLFWNKKFNYPFLSYFLPILVFFMTFMSLQFLNTYLIHLDYLNHSFKEIIIFLILVLSFVIIISFLLWQLEKRLVSNKVSFGYQLVFKLALTFLLLNLPLIAVIILKNSNSENYIEIFPFLYLVIGLTLGRGLLIYLNHFSDSLVKEKDVELSRLKEVNAQSELKLLQSHINPHFLYNALNSIAGLAHNNPDKTEKMALSLSNLFRYSINKKGQKMSTVKEEVVMVENYLDIEKIRFGERLKFTLHVDEALENEQIPMYILQPLVENAIKHGVSEIRGEGHIALEIKKELEAIVITVSDNGPDFPEGLVSGHGLQTVYDLLRLSYDDKASLTWENTPVKQISILINELI
jgi:sensor histidine kinase YesM